LAKNGLTELSHTSFPEADPELMKVDSVTVVFQVNGKLRQKIEVPSGLQKEELEKLALSDERIQKWLDGKEIVKIIAVPDKLINIVVKA
jgi:leucyl-tRNA synthetase